MTPELDLHQKRELDKIGLETYPLDNHNMFDYAVDNLIDKLNKDVLQLRESFDGWNNLEESDPERYQELFEQSEQYGHNISHQQHETFLNIIYHEEQLLALVEMKIIYSFKTLEIQIKKLLLAAFSQHSGREFYRWDALERFMRDRNINIKAFNSYKGIVQLKDVCNTVKHLGEYEVSLSQIQEFSTNTNMHYENLETFYQRVKTLPGIFVQELAWAIYKELYQFDDQKIETIATSLILRLEKEDAIKLINKIRQQYQL